MLFHSSAAILGFLSLMAPSLATPGISPRTPSPLDPDAQPCPISAQQGPNVMVSNVQIPSTPPRTELILWSWGDSWCSKAVKVSDDANLCQPTLNRAPEFKSMPFTDRFGNFNKKCYADVNIYFYGCTFNPDGSLNYDNVRANFVWQYGNNPYPGQHQDYDCTYDTENRACPYNPGYGTQTEFEGFMQCGCQGGT